MKNSELDDTFDGPKNLYSLEEALRENRPVPPRRLLERCLNAGADGPSPAQVEHLIWSISMKRKLIVGGAGSMVAAAGLVVCLMWLAPSKSGLGPSRAEAVTAALRQLQSVDAVEMRSEFESPDGSKTWWNGLFVRDAGFRIVDANGNEEVYVASEDKRYRIEQGGVLISVLKLTDDGIMEEMLRRTRVSENFEYHMLRGLDDESVKETHLELAGVLVQRLEATDERGMPIIVELDLANERLLMAESAATSPEGGVVRCVVRFAYPDELTVDVSLIRPPVSEGKVLVEEPASRIQCMVNVRNLCMAVALYASEHDDAMPASIKDLARYAPKGDLATCSTCEDGDGGPIVKIDYVAPKLGGAKRYSELTGDPTAVIFVCRLADGEIRGFADGHAEFVTPEEPASADPNE